MSVLLVSPPSFSSSEKFYIPCAEIPLSLCLLAAYLEEKGIACDILDIEVERPGFSFQKYLAGKKPRLVGFTAFSPYVEHAHALAREVKEWDASTLTVLGGYHASAFPRAALEEFPAFDALVYGEGEATLHELAAKAMVAAG